MTRRSNAKASTPWLARRLQGGLQAGLERAARGLQVDPQRFLLHLQRAHGLPLNSYSDLFSLPVDELDRLAALTIRATTKMGAIEGTGLGLGGFLTLVPDLGFLSTLTGRMIQKLSLIYGFPYATEEEKAELWLAIASASGLDIGKEFLEKQVIERLVPRIIERVAVRASTEVAEKWAARAIPLLSGLTGGALNYFFLRKWGRRAQAHFRARHLERRATMRLGAAQ